MIQLKHRITDDRRKLILLADDDVRAALAEMMEDEPRNPEAEAMDYLTSNSELSWVDPSECGDLTDAPILGIRGEEYVDVEERWGFMDYALRSFVTDLIESGKAVFIAP